MTTCPPLSPELLALIEKAKRHVMTPEEQRAQRISFVYGQLMDCAPHVTKEEVARIHDQEYSALPAPGSEP
jgi:hypothetical protein